MARFISNMKITRTPDLLQFLTISALIFTTIHSQTLPQPQIDVPQIIKQFPFQKIIWTYWNSNTTQPPIIVQLCIDNMAKVAEKHNFTFILVNESNVRDYVQDYDELFVAVRQKSIQRSFTHAADLLRMLIIEQHGGIWVDTTTIFLNGLSQLQNIMSQQYEHMIANRFSPQPQAMFFYQSNGQNRIQHTISHHQLPQKTILYNQYPDYQIWSIFATKNSPFISQVRKTYSQFTVTPFIQSQQRFVSEDIYISYIDNNWDYLYLNMAVTYVLQKKQMEMDKELTLLGKRKYVYEEYKVWGLHAEYGPMLTTREDLLPFDYLFWYSKQELLEMGFDFRFFMKQFGYIRKVTGEKFDALLKYFDNNHMTFMNFLYNYMDKATCKQVTFIVEGSIIDELLAGSQVYKKHRFLVLTKAQNQQWLEHCAWKDTFWDKVQKKWRPYHETISLYRSFYYKVHKAKVQSILHEKQSLSLIQWIKTTYEDNFFLIYEFVYMMVVAGMLFGSYVAVKWAVLRYLKGTIIFNEAREIAQESNKYKNILKLILALVVLNMFMFNAVDLLGGRDQPVAILFCVLVTFMIQAYIEEQLKVMKQQNSLNYSSANSVYELFFMLINYLSGFLCLVHVWRNRFWLNWFAQVLGMVGPCVFKLKQAIYEKHLVQKGKQSTRQTYEQQQAGYSQKAPFIIRQNPHRTIVILFLLITILMPNLRYISGESGYYIKYICFIPLTYLIVIFLHSIIRCISHNYWRQITRLVIIIVISTRLYMTINQIDTMVQKLPRVSFFAMNFIVMSLVYLQIGLQTRGKSETVGVFRNLSLGLWEWVYMIFPLMVELLLGLVWFNHYTMGSAFVDYYLHYVFFMYNAFIAVILSTLDKDQGEQARNLGSELKSVQFDTFEEEQYNHVNDQ